VKNTIVFHKKCFQIDPPSVVGRSSDAVLIDKQVIKDIFCKPFFMFRQNDSVDEE